MCAVILVVQFVSDRALQVKDHKIITGLFGNPLPCGVPGRFPAEEGHAEIFHEVFLGSIWKPATRGFLTRSSLFFTRNRARPTEVG